MKRLRTAAVAPKRSCASGPATPREERWKTAMQYARTPSDHISPARRDAFIPIDGTTLDVSLASPPALQSRETAYDRPEAPDVPSHRPRRTDGRRAAGGGRRPVRGVGALHLLLPDRGPLLRRRQARARAAADHHGGRLLRPLPALRDRPRRRPRLPALPDARGAARPAPVDRPLVAALPEPGPRHLSRALPLGRPRARPGDQLPPHVGARTTG